ncbi:GNAT family N-acetyltransferase [uncultured Thiodictyon sp.]|uniref:GNAT family N-acetyltransferase n=1 Tax=uncultured Thiodictyon sp. TaxID=1846217 RepID=UPI0025DC866D|nr:GNAT family N-acetyltransferase [uncultured Thiodictyon sp.]
MSAGALEFVVTAALTPDQAAVIAETLAGMDPWRTLGYSAAALTGALVALHPDLTRYLALRDGEPQGLVVVRHPWLRGAYIELFAVLPAAQGRGVGRAALEFVESRYRDRSPNLWLLVSGFNSGARCFYEKHGFRPVGVIADLVVTGQDEVLMRKIIRCE